MDCTVCGYSWCWVCGQKHSEYHNKPYNPFGCQGILLIHSSARGAVVWISILNFIFLPFTTLFMNVLYFFITTLFMVIDFNRSINLRSRFFKRTRCGKCLYA